MHGYRLTFFTQEDRQHHGKNLARWILEEARRLGAPGGTLAAGGEGFGHTGKMHSAGFLEMADRPVTVSIAVDEATCGKLMEQVREAGVDVFYTWHEIEFGRLGKAD